MDGGFPKSTSLETIRGEEGAWSSRGIDNDNILQRQDVRNDDNNTDNRHWSHHVVGTNMVVRIRLCGQE